MTATSLQTSPSLADTLVQLEQSRVRDYYAMPMPSPLDEAVAALARRYSQAPAAERTAIDARISLEHSYGFLIFAERMAALAVRERSVERVRDGLLGLALEHFRLDLREDLMVFSLLHHSARRIGADADALFRSLGPPTVAADVAQEFERFAQRPAELKQIRVFGYHEVSDDTGFRYDRIRR